eukprot:4541795-Pleurochrysis_carterae.AAC.1
MTTSYKGHYLASALKSPLSISHLAMCPMTLMTQPLLSAVDGSAIQLELTHAKSMIHWALYT